MLYNFRQQKEKEEEEKIDNSFFAEGELVKERANVLVSLCAGRHSHDLTFAFAPVLTADSTGSPEKTPVTMVAEEGGTTAVVSSAGGGGGNAPNRLILLRPHSVGCRYYHHHHPHPHPHPPPHHPLHLNLHPHHPHQKRPSSVNSSSSGQSDHTKDSDGDCGSGLASDNSADNEHQQGGGSGSNSSSDCEYGPGFVGRLCNKFMTMYSGGGQESAAVQGGAQGGVPVPPTSPSAVNGTGANGLIKRCSSMEELTYRSRNGLAANGKPANSANGTQQTNGHSTTTTTTTNHHQQVNGTKRRLLWSSLTNGHSNGSTAAAAAAVSTNGHGSRGGYLKNGYSQSNKVTNGAAVTTNGSAAAAASPLSPPSPSPTSAITPTTTATSPPALYPSNIVKKLVKSHQSSANGAKSTSVAPISSSSTVVVVSSSSSSGATAVASSTEVTTSGAKSGAIGSNGTVRHYPSPITHNYVRSNPLLLTAPLPYIRKAKSVEALSVLGSHFSVSTSGEEEDPKDSEEGENVAKPTSAMTAVDGGRTGNRLLKIGGGGNQPAVMLPANDEPLCYHEQQQKQSPPPVRSNEHDDCTAAAIDQQSAIVRSTGATSTATNNTMVDSISSTAADETVLDATTAKVADENGKEEEEEKKEVGEMSGRLASAVVAIHGSEEEELVRTAAADGLDVQPFTTNTTALNIGSLSSSSLLNDSGICETLESTSASMMMSGDNSTTVPVLSPPSPQPSPSSSVLVSASQRRLQPQQQQQQQPLSSISDSEMPKPDTVKTVKRLFESPNGSEGATTMVVSPTPTPTTTTSSLSSPVKSSPSDNGINHHNGDSSSSSEVGPKHPKTMRAGGDESSVMMKTSRTPPAIPSRAPVRLPLKSTTIVSSPSKPAIPPRRTPVTTNSHHPHHPKAQAPPPPPLPFSRSTQSKCLSPSVVFLCSQFTVAFLIFLLPGANDHVIINYRGSIIAAGGSSLFTPT